jgi:parvulin-like peptidyl-prolyl isomerase
MAKVLQVGSRTFAAEELIPLLASYQIVPQLLCESIIDEAIASISCTPEEIEMACQQFEEHWELTCETKKQAWLNHYGMSQEQLELLATRKLRIEKFKQETWGHKLESYFLKRKSHLDRAIYSLLRTKDKGIANELYFRLSEGEQSFADLAREYSQGPEAETGGLMGPVELGTLNPHLVELLYTSQPGQVSPPLPFGEWYVIVRLEKLLPAQFNEAMRQRLLGEFFQAWFQEQLEQLPHQDKIWMGAASPRQVNTTASLVED